MNERIGELAEQAKQHSLDAMIKITDREQALKVYSESYDTKFAELIIQECITAIYKSQNITPGFLINLPSDQLVLQIKKHFGVD
jgi:hypothetical protein